VSSPSAARSAGPLYGEAELRALAAEINRAPDAALIFADSPNTAIRQKALDILAEAERRYSVTTNAVTAHSASRGFTILVFRDARVTRAEVLEELCHLEWARRGNWDRDLPGMFTAFQLRELDAAAHFRNLLREGAITQLEFDETIRNLAHYLSAPSQRITEVQALAILEGLAE
jgi:hypothetical protein